MKVGTRLTILCSLIFGIVFACCSVLIYLSYHKSAERTVFNNLEKNAYISAFFYLEEDELEPEEFAKIKLQFKNIVPQTSYQIYNEDNLISYGLEHIEFPSHILQEIRDKSSYAFKYEDKFCYGIYYKDNQGDFVIITKENKSVLGEQMNSLLTTLVSAFVLGLIAIILLSSWIAHIAYRPFKDIIKQVNTITTNNLDVQIDLPNTKDELQELIQTFNDLLVKISETFLIQKNFINYVSHEFRTPLTAVLGNLEVFSLKERSPEEYKELTERLIKDIHQLEEILDALMVVSDLRVEDKINMNTRIDEIIWDVVNKLNQKYANAKIDVNINIKAEDENLMYLHIESTPLFMALLNLMDNSIKYSKNKSVDLNLYSKDGKMALEIIDQGVGIPKEQLEYIHKPFFRAKNATHAQGLGIGLSIALRIFEKNKITYTILSEEGVGTTIRLEF